VGLKKCQQPAQTIFLVAGDLIFVTVPNKTFTMVDLKLSKAEKPRAIFLFLSIRINFLYGLC
jgi:hypothetical protein